MKEQGNQKSLDELIAHTICTTKPQFDPEKWKQEYPKEFQTLLSQGLKAGSSHQPSMLRIIFRNPITKFAASAALVTVALFIVGRTPRGPEPTQVRQQTASAVEMATAISLERAYRRGGIQAVEDQCRIAFGTATRESTSPSILQLLGEQGAGAKIFGGNNLW